MIKLFSICIASVLLISCQSGPKPYEMSAEAAYWQGVHDATIVNP